VYAVKHRLQTVHALIREEKPKLRRVTVRVTEETKRYRVSGRVTESTQRLVVWRQEKVPVSERAWIARTNRKLAEDGVMLRKSRGKYMKQEWGPYYTENTRSKKRERCNVLLLPFPAPEIADSSSAKTASFSSARAQ
jgi:hypothetical protein